MGFTTGLLSGTALTLSTLYLTLQAHNYNRARQSHLLRASSTALDAIVDPTAPSAAELKRQRVRQLNAAYRVGAAPAEAELAAQGGVGEMARVRWNREVRGAVRWVAEKDWSEVGRGFVGGVVGAWRGLVGRVEGEGSK